MGDLRALGKVVFATQGVDVVDVLLSIDEILDRWLSQKGEVVWSGDVGPGISTSGLVRLSEGGEAETSRALIETTKGSLLSLQFDQDVPGGRFRTRLRVASQDDRVVVACELLAGHGELGSPRQRFEPRIPGVLRTILALDLNWRLGTHPVNQEVMRLLGLEGGDAAAQLILDPERPFPVVVISEYDGLVLHPGIAERVAHDLAGVAAVLWIDTEAAWVLTEQLGRERSCYLGAVRVYWPGSVLEDDPRRHPLWTASRLVAGFRATLDADRAIRGRIRRMVLAASTFLPSPEHLIGEIESAHLSKLIDAANDNGGNSIAELRRTIRELEDKRDELELENQNLRYRLEYLDVGGPTEEDAGPVPSEDLAPDSVEDAVRLASEKHGDLLAFGHDVVRGVRTVDPTAGPPDKILMHLDHLAELGSLLRDGSIGKNIIDWLEDRGVIASQENAAMLRNRREKSKRTWDCDGSPKVYTFHTKPKEGTHPDRCVRIYFHWDDVSRRMFIGWVGRHP